MHLSSVTRPEFRLAIVTIGVILLQELSLSRSAIGDRMESPQQVQLDRSLQEGQRLLLTGFVREAAGLFGQGYLSAAAQRDWSRAIVFLGALGNSRFGLFEYRSALDAYLEAKRLVETHRDQTYYGAICANLSSLYLEVGDINASARVAEQGLVRAASHGNPESRPLLLAQLGTLRARQRRLTEAEACFREAISAAERQGNQMALATAWDHLGQELLLAGKPNEAEGALLEGFRIRKLMHNRKLSQSYFHLSRLRLDQGDVRAAATLLDRALGLPGNPDTPPPWMLYRQQAWIKKAAGQREESVSLLRAALTAAEDWRAEVSPVDALQSSSADSLHSLYQQFVDESLQLPRPRLVEAFAAAERDRAASLRQVLMTAPGWRMHMPSEYWDTLARLRAAQTGLIARDTPEGRVQVNRLRYQLLELEARSGLTPTTPGVKSGEKYSAENTLNTIRHALGPDEAFLSVSLGDSDSCLWVVTRHGLEWSRLPPRRVLCALADGFRQAIEGRSQERDRLAEDLYRALFGALSARVRAKTRWLLAADDALFAVPFSALVVERQRGKPVYLVERHTNARVPSAFFVAQIPASAGSGEFLGVGDGVYNTADPRWHASRGAASAVSLQLPRLAASREELAACARQWNAVGSSRLLLGPACSRVSFQAALADRPSVIHIAAHVLQSPDGPDRALIGLGLTGNGELDVLTREDIAALRVPGSTVVMSGCASAAARAAPSSGVLGLARAWLIAGAGAVVGSHWAIGDDSGELLATFYRYFGELRVAGNEKRVACEALRRAQLDALRSNSWRSDPRYWSAFFTVGKN